ncbi:MAG: HEAT repeat domain-containing protein [Planctomycetes bacterium]|nr:HEAT repeat domain-containing protein [Planctomycetota bacterium]MCB9891580.1 HEAT repeat domain-containing protein [Planctomycetota bacterium]
MKIAWTLLCALPLVCAEPSAQEDEKDGPKRKPPVPEASKDEARDMLKDFKKGYGKKSSLGERLRAVEKLGKKRHEKFVSELSKVLDKDPDGLVRAEAAKSMAAQRSPKAGAALLDALKKVDTEKDQVVLLAILENLVDVGYSSRFFDPLSTMFLNEKTTASVQQKIIQVFDQVKEKRAFRLLVDHLDEPIPEDVDDPSNPPAAWWEARWKRWSVWRYDVRKALKNLTGIRLENSKLYRKWAELEGKEQGFEY